jgi:hypothetical protein
MRSQRRSSLWRLSGLVALVGLANLVVLLAQAPALVHNLYLNADNASALVLPALARHAPAGSVINLGNHPWYEPWWLMRATAGFPDYRALWEAGPFVFGLLGMAVVSVCAWWALGWLAGLVCATALLASSEALRQTLYVPESHGAIVLHVGVLCGALLIVHRAALRRRAGAALFLLVGVPLVIFTGAGLTDQLLIVSGLVPFMTAPLLCWLRSRSATWRTVSWFALVTGVLSVLLALLLAKIMQEQHVVHSPFPVSFVTQEAIVAGVENLIGTVTVLGGGFFFGGPASGTNLLVFAAGVLTLLALAAVLRALWRWIGVTWRGSKTTVAEAHEIAADVTESLEAAEQPATGGASAGVKPALSELFIAYWGVVLVVVLAAFALTSVSGSTNNERYIIAAWFALAALLGILTTSPWTRIAVLAGVAAFGVLNLHAELTNGVSPAGVGARQRMAGVIEHYALARGASIGYSGYWEAAPVTWETDLRVTVRPIAPCNAPTGICGYFNNNISTWYVARPGIRTFLLTDTQPNIPGELAAPPPVLGHALAHAALGEGYSIYIYNHDIASDLSSE